jgi:hypothetical protein
MRESSTLVGVCLNVVFAVTLAKLQYIGRAVISQAARLLMKDRAISKEQMNWSLQHLTKKMKRRLSLEHQSPAQGIIRMSSRCDVVLYRSLHPVGSEGLP